jgi:signal transduction histidine kinase
MRHKHLYIQLLIVLVSALISVNQVVWITNMYHLHKKELNDYANQAANQAVYFEVIERGASIGGCVIHSKHLSNYKDTTRYVVKKVWTKDKSYIINYDKQDASAMNKVVQLMFKDKKPVNLKRLNVFFRSELSDKYALSDSYFDYLDLKKNKTIKSNKPVNASANFLRTDTIPLDIFNSIGVVGYIEVPYVTILNKIGLQLILSVLLILIGIGCMIYLGRSFVMQWKLERLRQESVNSMTHEFKRPISSAVAMVSLIPYYSERDELSKLKTYAENTIIELNKLTAYTERIQQISNNERVNIVLNKTELEIEPFIQSIKERYSDMANNDKKVIIHTEVNTKKKCLFVDILHFSNILDNLVENAIKYSKAEVNTLIDVVDTKEGIKISVKDNGLGISTFDLRFIFDRFYRSNRKELKHKTGFGLGLTYVKSMVEAHGGSITVSSTLNEGSEFIILLKEQ